MHYQSCEEFEKSFREGNVLYWAKSLLKMTYDFIDRALGKAAENPPFDIPRLRFVDAGLVLAYSQRPVSTAYLAEEFISGLEDDFIKFIHNGEPTPLPDPGEPGYEIAEFLAFTQHVQYSKTGGQAYISNYQGTVVIHIRRPHSTHADVYV
ncbi:hypothetical protein HYDPIDRAFT_96509 [Hydnomerulius pinastri MD-312]|uniref:Alpha-type protein kinase domain-containing protein n=1 Tax=Hydnomerulius pinastri MD-312 TaxID=994086 RepID=A0A0C9WC60_9AGAM|nr:hypothetical protein HYDPIDRAFT_96509 [Hydnomerulius pinastri MD-312]